MTSAAVLSRQAGPCSSRRAGNQIANGSARHRSSVSMMAGRAMRNLAWKQDGRAGTPLSSIKCRMPIRREQSASASQLVPCHRSQSFGECLSVETSRRGGQCLPVWLTRVRIAPRTSAESFGQTSTTRLRSGCWRSALRTLLLHPLPKSPFRGREGCFCPSSRRLIIARSPVRIRAGPLATSCKLRQTAAVAALAGHEPASGASVELLAKSRSSHPDLQRKSFAMDTRWQRERQTQRCRQGPRFPAALRNQLRHPAR